MSLGVKLDHLRGPSAPGEKLARVTFRGKFCFESQIYVLCSPVSDTIFAKNKQKTL